LLPALDSPLWAAGVRLAGGRPVPSLCDETAGWLPDPEDIAARITDRTRALVVINPNNPTGAVYPVEALERLVQLARRHNPVVFSAANYEKILCAGGVRGPNATRAPHPPRPAL